MLSFAQAALVHAPTSAGSSLVFLFSLCRSLHSGPRLSSLNLLVHAFFSIPSPTSPYLHYFANSYSCFSFSPSVSSSKKPSLTSPVDVDHSLILYYVEYNPISTPAHSDPSLCLNFFVGFIATYHSMFICLLLLFFISLIRMLGL